jgi:hypothetical protein
LGIILVCVWLRCVVWLWSRRDALGRMDPSRSAPSPLPGEGRRCGDGLQPSAATSVDPGSSPGRLSCCRQEGQLRSVSGPTSGLDRGALPPLALVGAVVAARGRRVHGGDAGTQPVDPAAAGRSQDQASWTRSCGEVQRAFSQTCGRPRAPAWKCTWGGEVSGISARSAVARCLSMGVGFALAEQVAADVGRLDAADPGLARAPMCVAGASGKGR